MAFPRFVLSQVKSSWPTAPTRFVEIPKIPDRELKAFCALCKLWNEKAVYTPQQYTEIANEFAKRLDKRSYMKDEILRYLSRECPCSLTVNPPTLQKPQPPHPPPPPPPPPKPAPPVATPGSRQGENFYCMKCGPEDYRMMRRAEGEHQGCTVAPQEECSPYRQMERIARRQRLTAQVPPPSPPRPTIAPPPPMVPTTVRPPTPTIPTSQRSPSTAADAPPVPTRPASGAGRILPGMLPGLLNPTAVSTMTLPTGAGLPTGIMV